MNIIVSNQLQNSLMEARKEWGWFLALGTGLVLLGFIAIAYESVATLASVFALGIFLLASGIMQIVAAFEARSAGHVVLYLLFGALEIVVGLMLMQHPVAGALLVTLTLAIYLVFSGIFRTIYSLLAHFPHYGWAVFSGVISVLLGLLLWAQWPTSAIWFLGLAVGINFIFTGISWIRLAMTLHTPQSAPA